MILASGSERRKCLLRQAGLEFRVVRPEGREGVHSALPPKRLVEKLALAKANDVAGRCKDCIVIGADTILVCRGKKLGKPKNSKQALEMLSWISGKTVTAYSGVAIVDSTSGKKVVDSEKTTLTIRKLADAEMRAYIKTKEPLEKAGAIAIQGRGAKFISRISGSRSNVIGLPMELLTKMLKKVTKCA